MALDHTAATNLDATSAMEVEHTNSTNPIMFQKGAGPSSFFRFKSNPNAKLFKSKAVECVGTVKYLSKEHVSTYLDEHIPDAFQLEAANNGLTLINVVELLKEKLEEISNEPTATGKAKDEKLLATMIAMVGPKLSPEELVDQFKKLCETHMEAALNHLVDCEQRNGRNSEGRIYLRSQKKIKASKVARPTDVNAKGVQ